MHLKVPLVDGTFNVRLLRVSDSTICIDVVRGAEGGWAERPTPSILAENCVFFLPLCHSAPPLPIFPLEFRDEVKRQKTRVMGLLCGEGCMILTSTVFD